MKRVDGRGEGKRRERKGQGEGEVVRGKEKEMGREK